MSINQQDGSKNSGHGPHNLVKKDPYRALRFSDFRFFLATKILLTISIQIQAVVVGWHVYELTKDPLSLGLIGLAEILPNFAVTLFAGHFADLYNRKKIVFICLMLLLCTSFSLYWNGIHQGPQQLYMIYVLIGISGLARGTMGPSLFSIMTECVPKEHYVNSTTWHSTLWQIATMFGAGASGFVFSYIRENSYLLITTFEFFAILCFFFIAPKPQRHQAIHVPIFSSIKSGIKFVLKNEIFLGALSLDLFAVLFGGAVALLPIFANEILKVGPQGLGFLKAAPSLGSFLMAAYLVYHPPSTNAGKKLLLAVMGFGTCMIMFALSKNFYLSVFVLVLSGALDNVSVVIRGTIMQTLTPPDMKGRVSAVNSVFVGSSNEIGAFESGLAARFMGVVPSVVFGGTMTLFIVIFTYFRSPKLKELNFH